MTIVRIDALSELARPAGLIELVDEIQASPPYSYAPGEIPPAADWFTSLVGRAEPSLVALDTAIEERPIGYCVALSWETYGKLDGYAERLGIDPVTTMYVAELGIAPSARRRGLASALLTELDQYVPSDTTACVVRTLAANEPAIALYQKHGYQLVDGVDQAWHGRTRVFLVRQSG